MPSPEPPPAPWRETVRERMRQAALREVEVTGRRGFAYRWEHVLAVVANALRLAELTGADPDVVEAAAWLHDARKTEPEHAARGAELARRLLPETDFPPAKVEAVAGAIASHEGLWRDEPLTVLEAQVLWDADKLTKVGVLGALHGVGDKIAGGGATTAGLIRRAQDAEWRARSVASMHTAPARAAARKRLAAWEAFWAGVEAEGSGGDLG